MECRLWRFQEYSLHLWDIWISPMHRLCSLHWLDSLPGVLWEDMLFHKAMLITVGLLYAIYKLMDHLEIAPYHCCINVYVFPRIRTAHSAVLFPTKPWGTVYWLLMVCSTVYRHVWGIEGLDHCIAYMRPGQGSCGQEYIKNIYILSGTRGLLEINLTFVDFYFFFLRMVSDCYFFGGT